MTNSKTRLFHLCILLASGTLLLLAPLPDGFLFGSNTDWFSQHVTLAEHMRQQFAETGKLIPDFSGLGGGCNFFCLSYYGFLRPDVLLSYLLPKVPMETILSGYAVFLVLLGGALLYLWLSRHTQNSLVSLTCGIFYLSAGCMFQAHRQLMFVNYLPFLILAFLSIDALPPANCRNAGKRLPFHPGLVLSMLMLLLHSYYFFPACFVACGMYLLFQKKSRVLYLTSAFVSLCMAMVLLLPTLLAILENKKDTAPVSLSEILSVNPSMNSLLYSVYGCGLTLFVLYALLLGSRQKKTRRFASCLLLLFFCPVFYWVLNGTLYTRPKSLIPFLPLALYLTALVMDGLQKKEIRHSPKAAALCALPGLVQLLFLSPGKNERLLIVLDICVLFFVIAASFSRKETLKRAGGFLLILTPVLFSLQKAGTESFVPASQPAREAFSPGELASLCGEPLTRLDFLEQPLTNTNYSVFGAQNKSSLYSSVSNTNYNHVFYDLLRMPVSIRNRVAINADANPFQEYLMGVRYIRTTREKLPAGYRILSQRDGHVLAENPSVLPLAYGSSTLMGETEFDRLSYPYNLEALTSRTIVPSEKEPENAAESTPSKDGFLPSDSKMVPYEMPRNFFSRPDKNSRQRLTKTLPAPIDREHMLLLSFDVSYGGKQDVFVTINHIKNCLSGTSAPYPNRNTTFTYMLSGSEPLRQLDIAFSAGNYSIENVTAFTFPLSAIKLPEITSFYPAETTGRELLKGSITMAEDGFFVTSFAFSHGYTALADGQKVTPVPINKGFVGFPLKKGTHEITLEFHAPGKMAGIFISSLASLYFIVELLLYCLRSARHKKRILRGV